MRYVDIKPLEAPKRTLAFLQETEKKGGEKWRTLRHNGVCFTSPYVPVPKDVQIRYNGKPIALSTDTKNSFYTSAEEAAYFFAQKLEQDERLSAKSSSRKKIVDSTFKKNFFKDWKKILGSNSPIEDIDKVDFRPFINYISTLTAEKTAARKDLTKEQKMSEKERKEQARDLYGYAVVDDVKIALSNYTVEPNGLFTGHGEAPKRGCIKRRIQPKDITLNVSLNYVPKCKIYDANCNWGEVVEDHTVTWLAKWSNPIDGKAKYVWLSRDESHWVSADDKEKFEKARALGKNIDDVKEKYRKDLSSSSKTKKQLATAVYLLDKLAIRPGTEKDEKKEAETLGLTTLKCESIEFVGDNKIKLDFVGKSSIKFVKTFKVNSEVYKNLQELCDGKKPSDPLFPNVDALELNGYLKTLLPGLTAKVFRTYKASHILEEELNSNIPDKFAPIYQKKLAFDKVGLEVALKLNHKKLGTNDERTQKLRDKIKDCEKKVNDAKTDKQREAAQKSLSVAESKLLENEENVSTSTSKANYMDPRIIVAWCKKAQMPIEKIYSKKQLQKFIWAMDTSTKWEF